VWQAYNDGKKTTFESVLTLVLREGTQLEVECLKGYRTIMFGNHWCRKHSGGLLDASYL
jgi:hypothetical protein